MSSLDEKYMLAWRKTRAGAWASRGFHYQHLITTLLLIKQWAGLVPAGCVVPEGLEDSVVEFPEYDVWLQVKSRKEGSFTTHEVKRILSKVKTKSSSIDCRKDIGIIIVLEREYPGKYANDFDEIFGVASENVLVSKDPEKYILELITSKLGTAEIVAEGIANDIYKLVSDVSADNASLSFDMRRRISVSDVEKRIFERLEASDPSVIDRALADRALEPVDFFTPVVESGFYQGVKVKPGHVAARLVFDRPEEIKDVISKLRLRRYVLISGPSGAGKSALLWMSANRLASEMRWYQIISKADTAHADSIIRFIRARRPSEHSPIALVFDEVGSSNSGLWDILLHELRAYPSVYMLGSSRSEDLGLISNHADTEFVELRLGEKLAENIWEKLSESKGTSWLHWREPLEQSEGLMLEYIHLLTQGKRLSSVIADQVRQRERENRGDELAIIRSTAALCARGGEVEVRKLVSVLGIEAGAASNALKRLLDEHLVRESKKGVLGGLHALRSEALYNSAHDEIVYLRSDSLWDALPAATIESLPVIVQAIIRDTNDKTEVEVLGNLAGILEKSNETETWIAILNGLGLATLERYAIHFMEILTKNNIKKAQWSLAAMFFDPRLDIPEMPQLENWEAMRNAILEFRASPKEDLRKACLDLLPSKSAVPGHLSLLQANSLFSCLAPIAGEEPIRLEFECQFGNKETHDIRDIAKLLSNAYFWGPEMARELADKFGGEEVLFQHFRSQTPWVTDPVIESEARHGRTVRSNRYYASEGSLENPNDTLVDICKTLISISPASDAAASDIINPVGNKVMIGEHTFGSKNIQRDNLPAEARVSWNVVFRNIVNSKAAAVSLTEYTTKMSELVKRTEKVFKTFSEKWIGGKRIPNKDDLAKEVNSIIGSVNELAYAAPVKTESSIETQNNDSKVDDTLGALLTGVLGHLMVRMSKIPSENGAKAVACFAGDLASQAQKHMRSNIWRTISNPPTKQLQALQGRLSDLSYIIHEMAHDSSDKSIQRIVSVAKKANLGKKIVTTSKRCHLWAEARLKKKLSILKNELNAKGLSTMCNIRSLNERDSPYWPACEVAIIIEIDSFEGNEYEIERVLDTAQELIGSDYQFSIVPAIAGNIIGALAIRPSSRSGALPDTDFEEKWIDYVGLPFLSMKMTSYFDKAYSACIELSAIVNCCDIENLHFEEELALSKAIEVIEYNRDLVEQEINKTGDQYFTYALEFMNQYWAKVTDEYETVKGGESLSEPLCMSAHHALNGQQTNWNAECAGIRLLLLQAECRQVNLKS